MKGRWRRCLWMGMLVVLAGCESHSLQHGQQAQEEIQEQVPEGVGKAVNTADYVRQVQEVQVSSPRLFSSNNSTYQAVQAWMQAGGDTRHLDRFGLNVQQMEGVDRFGNVQFTGYYTPVIQARRTAEGEFRYPLYSMPKSRKGGRLPSRAAIHAGALDRPELILAYSNSLMDNFLMEVQGSGYVDFGDGTPLVFFSYGGKNGHAYRSIGKVLVERGEVALEEMSMQAIRRWAESHSEAEVRELLEQNPSFVFFTPRMSAPVKGASAVPLVAGASVASDRSLVPAGTTLLAEVPVLDADGKFHGRYEVRLLVSLDVGGAIKGHHFDLYQGIGADAGEAAGFYNHYGRVWVLNTASRAALPFSIAHGTPDVATQLATF